MIYKLTLVKQEFPSFNSEYITSCVIKKCYFYKK